MESIPTKTLVLKNPELEFREISDEKWNEVNTQMLVKRPMGHSTAMTFHQQS